MKTAHRLVLLLLILQALATSFLWTLDPTGRGAQATFATMLGVDLVAFAAISYLYRGEKTGESPSRAWLTVGLVVTAILLVSGLFTA